MFPGGAQLLEFSSADALFGAPATEAQGSISVAAGAKMIFQPTLPVAIVRWGFICTTTVNDATNALKLTLDWHPTVGSASSPVVGATTQLQGQTGWNASALPAFFTDLAGGSLTLVASASQIAAGKGVYHQINPQTKMPPNDASTNPVPSPDTAFVPGGGQQSLGLTIYPGQEVQITSQATAPAAGAGVYFIHFYHLAFQGSGSNYENVASGIPSSITPIVGDPGIWTRALS